MNWVSVPVVMMASVALYVGLYYIWMYLKRRDTESILFAASCLAIALYDILCAGLYNASNIHEGVAWQKLQFASLTILSISLLWFVYHYTGARVRKTFIGLTVIFSVLFLLGLLIDGTLTVTPDNPMLKHVRLGDLINITYYESDPGPVYIVQFIAMMAGYIFLMYLMIGNYRSGNRRVLPVLVAFGIFFFAALNDVLVAAAVYPFVYLAEYTYMLIILSMAHAFLNSFVDLHNRLGDLNVNLEKKVEARTEELQAAFEELEAINDRLAETNDTLEKAQRIALRDMNMAVNLQMNILPKEPPRVKGWDIAFSYRPMAGVSGDIYDFYTYDGTLLGLSLFDVSGHGISSGLITLLAKSIAFRNFSKAAGAGLDAVIGRINRELKHEIGSVDQYLSGIVLLFKGNRVQYVNAGHPDILHRQDENGNCELVNPPQGTMRGPLLGVENFEGNYDAYEFEMRRGDSLLLYTDAIFESRNPDGEPYGIERVMKSFCNAGGGPAQEMLSRMIDDFSEFLGNEPVSDDMTVIVVKRTE
jgi:sigma-B regulation protein RsbU (phosphoserine phosphatase)